MNLNGTSETAGGIRKRNALGHVLTCAQRQEPKREREKQRWLRGRESREKVGKRVYRGNKGGLRVGWISTSVRFQLTKETEKCPSNGNVPIKAARSNERPLGRMHLAACYRLACRPCGSTFDRATRLRRGVKGDLLPPKIIAFYRLSPVTPASNRRLS